MSAGAAALLAMLATAYLAIGAAWAFMVFVIRVLCDEPVSWSGAAAQALLWPWAVWISLRGGE